MKGQKKIERVLMSVTDKRGLPEFGKFLHDAGCEIISTGGTRHVLMDAGIPVTEIQMVTGNPEAFGGRMKTISFAIESALLFDREKDKVEAEALGIQPIDLVVCNLYPFEMVKKRGADIQELIENIDIGGPTMIRAAAKNYQWVTTVVDPDDYPMVMENISKRGGNTDIETRFKLMRKAFNYTANYDSLIAVTMDERAGEPTLRFAYEKPEVLRYGENSHQKGMIYRLRNAPDSLYDMEILHGKKISYNNMVDLYGALETVRDLKRTGCAIIKHANPCGLCDGSNQREVFEKAWAGDPVSAFGSVIAFNKPVTLETTKFLHLDAKDKSQRKFVEILAAPAFDEPALDYLKQHKNLRIVLFDPARIQPTYDMKFIYNTLLYQDTDRQLLEKVEYVSQKKAPVDEGLMQFGLIAVRQLKSNAICIARRCENGDYQLLGMGCGQPNRVNSTQLSIARCRENLKAEYQGNPQYLEAYIQQKMGEAVLFSDAFFPFPDNVEISYEAGIRMIVQPGGSIRDMDVIKKVDELEMTLIFTGLRHFKH